MGLNNMWVRKERVSLPFNPPLNLAGMDTQGHFPCIFRGKAYDDVILEVADCDDFSLYDDHHNGEINHIAECLEDREWEDLPDSMRSPGAELIDSQDSPVTKEEYLDLRRMFRAFADAGCDLEAGY
jgi:hypothetical protein